MKCQVCREQRCSVQGENNPAARVQQMTIGLKVSLGLWFESLVCDYSSGVLNVNYLYDISSFLQT